MAEGDLCPKCEQATLEVDDLSSTVACPDCGHVLTQEHFVNNIEFYFNRPTGQVVEDVPGAP